MQLEFSVNPNDTYDYEMVNKLIANQTFLESVDIHAFFSMSKSSRLKCKEWVRNFGNALARTTVSNLKLVLNDFDDPSIPEQNDLEQFF